MIDPVLSLIIPTRERARYLASCLRTCIASSFEQFEILVLDNASQDDTPEVVAAAVARDPRIRYLRSERRLSMRDNFEKGVNESRGRYLGIIGDDDGIFPFTPERVVELFETLDVEAVSAARAHYSWPDLLSPRAGMGLVPRGQGVEVRSARSRLRHLLRDDNYYQIPCIYHGFVARSAINRAAAPQGRFFVSSIVDAASSIALGMLDLRFAFSHMPLVINGGSQRSNGASQFGGGSEQEQTNWKVEDDLGYLPGFDDTETVGALIVETAARSAAANPGRTLEDILDPAEVRETLLREFEARLAKGRDEAEALKMFDSAKLSRPGAGEHSAPVSRLQRMRRSARLFLDQRPLDLLAARVTTVDEAARVMNEIVQGRQTGVLLNLPSQLRVAQKMASR